MERNKLIIQKQAFRRSRFSQPFTVELAYENTFTESNAESNQWDKTICNRFPGEQLSIREESDCDGDITIRIQKRNAQKTLKSK